MKRNSGFTFIEILVSVAIIGLLSGVVAFSLSSIKNTNPLRSAVTKARAFLEEARSLSIAGKNDMSYGVSLQSDRIVLFAGTTTSPQKTLFFNVENASIANVSLTGGGSVVLFTKITGATNNSGSFQMRLNQNTNSSSTISIGSTGIINSQ
jgi:prepilin-type N-terminal cleavage/methylation domain-containing protein